MRLRTLLAIFCILIAQLAHAADKPANLTDTLKLMQQHVAHFEMVASTQIDLATKTLIITFKDGTTAHSLPYNLHAILLDTNSAKERDTQIRQHMFAISEQYKAAQFSQSDLARVFPVLRGDDFQYIGNLPKADQLATSPFGGDVLVYFVKDNEHSTLFLTNEMIASAGISKADIIVRSYANLNRKTLQLRSMGSDIGMLVLDGYYESSLLVLDRFWAKQAQQMGPIAAIIPNRDLLLFTSTTNKENVSKLKALAQKSAAENPWPISDKVYFRKADGTWSTDEVIAK